jgi:branched-chain amino acid transport system permease protein
MTAVQTAPAAAATTEPRGRLDRLAPYATPLRVVGGVLTVLGAYLPWSTFVLNRGAYPEKATLEFFTAPFGVTGFRLHLVVFGVAAIVLALVKLQVRGRILRAIGWGVVAISVANGLYLVAEGGGLGTITAAGGTVAFGAVLALVGGVALIVGGTAGGLGEIPVWRREFGRSGEWAILLVVYALLLLLVAAVLTSGGQGSVANPYSGAVFLSFLGAVGGLLAALHAAGVLTWSPRCPSGTAGSA